MTRIALLTALSLILFVLEGFLPLPLPVPGAKLGLAAIVTLIALHLLPTRDAALMLTLRIFLASALGGGLAPMLYSLAGGAASFAAMVLLKKKHAAIHRRHQRGGRLPAQHGAASRRRRRHADDRSLFLRSRARLRRNIDRHRHRYVCTDNFTENIEINILNIMFLCYTLISRFFSLLLQF